MIGARRLLMTQSAPVFATLDPAKTGSYITLSGGNLIATKSTSPGWATALSTVGKTTGKWCIKVASTGSPNTVAPGIGTGALGVNGYYLGQITNGGAGVMDNAGTCWWNDINEGAWPNAQTQTLWIGLDANNRKMYVSTDGVNWDALASPALVGTGAIFFGVSMQSNTRIATFNFGQTPFSCPAGYNAGLWE
jgi:hypothetical protein